MAGKGGAGPRRTRPRQATAAGAQPVAPVPPGGETQLGLKRRVRKMARELEVIHPDAHCELDHGNALQLAVATILSAQCTDVKVNEVTPKLFTRYPTAAAYAGADQSELEEMIRPTGFFRNKTLSLIGLGRALTDRFGGEVPDHLDDLVTLPGIGRKTANVILGNAFGKAGITTDTHFIRLVGRWRWTSETDPVKIETAVGELVPKKDWTMLSHRVIFHGRRVCHARKPACGACPLARSCPSYGLGPTDPVTAAKLLKGPRVGQIAALAEQVIGSGPPIRVGRAAVATIAAAEALAKPKSPRKVRGE